MIHIVINCEPGKGRQNGRYVGKKFNLSQDYRDFRAACEKSVTYREKRRLEKLTKGRRLEVTVHSYWPRKHEGKAHLKGCAFGDVDAPVKATLDGLKHAGVYEDDDAVIACHAVKHYDSENPRVEVFITEWSEDSVRLPEGFQF